MMLIHYLLHPTNHLNHSEQRRCWILEDYHESVVSEPELEAVRLVELQMSFHRISLLASVATVVTFERTDTAALQQAFVQSWVDTVPFQGTSLGPALRALAWIPSSAWGIVAAAGIPLV